MDTKQVQNGLSTVFIFCPRTIQFQILSGHKRCWVGLRVIQITAVLDLFDNVRFFLFKEKY